MKQNESASEWLLRIAPIAKQLNQLARQDRANKGPELANNQLRSNS